MTPMACDGDRRNATVPGDWMYILQDDFYYLFIPYSLDFIQDNFYYFDNSEVHFFFFLKSLM